MLEKNQEYDTITIENLFDKNEEAKFMYAYIKGSLEVKSNLYIIVETGGIGYQIYMPQKAIEKLGEIGSQVKIYTHYHVREDNISLYGFINQEELRMFELLLSVSGIGAKSAISMLSEVSPSSFALSVITNDVSKLVKIPGIGKKTAARIVLELKDKLKTETATEKTEEIVEINQGEEKVDELIAALQVLGYTRYEINQVIGKIDVKELALEDSIKKALILLAK